MGSDIQHIDSSHIIFNVIYLLQIFTNAIFRTVVQQLTKFHLP